MTAVTGVVRGVVQGVGFRYATRWEAQRLGVTGWVRNLPGGAVEVWAQGTRASVDELCAFLEHGPRGAVVASVEVRPVRRDPDLDRFEIRF